MIRNRTAALLAAACVAGLGLGCRAHAGQETHLFTGGALPVNIPEIHIPVNDVRTITSAIANIADVNVFLEIGPQVGATNNAWNGDLYLKLTGPTGAYAILVNRVGKGAALPTVSGLGYGDDGFDITIDDTSQTASDVHYYRQMTSPAAGSPLTGTWLSDAKDLNPVSATGADFDAANRDKTLAGFNGANPNGVWTLSASDLAAGDRQQVVSWSITVNGAGGSDTFDFNGVNLEIPDNNPAGVADQRTISTAVTSVTSIVVRIKTAPVGEATSYPFNGDYYVSLTHGGAYAVLMNRVGRGINGSQYGYFDEGVDILLDDQAPADVHTYRNVTGVLPLGTPLTGSWQPDGRNVDPHQVLHTDPRTKLLSSFNGLNANGDWSISVVDHAEGDLGRLMNWGLVITEFVVGDTNLDGCVDDADVTNVILDFDTPGGGAGDTDIDDTGTVDDADLTLVILHYGEGC